MIGFAFFSTGFASRDFLANTDDFTSGFDWSNGLYAAFSDFGGVAVGDFLGDEEASTGFGSAACSYGGDTISFAL